MTVDPTRHTSACERDGEGWVMAACSCGYLFGPVPDDETATDVLMVAPIRHPHAGVPTDWP